MTEDTMTAQDLAEKAGVSQSYISRLCRRGRIKARKLGPVWLISPEAAQDYLEARQEKQAET